MSTNHKEAKVKARAASALADGCSDSTTSTSTAARFPQHQQEEQLYINKSEIRPSDVLCGRGHYKHPGNAEFLDLIGNYKKQYLNAPSHTIKDRIAKDIVEQIWAADVSGGSGDDVADSNEGGGGGGGGDVRFLQLKNDSGGIIWKIITDKGTVLEKVKMALRQKPKGKKAAVEAATTGSMAAAAASPANAVQSGWGSGGEQDENTTTTLSSRSPADGSNGSTSRPGSSIDIGLPAAACTPPTSTGLDTSMVPIVEDESKENLVMATDMEGDPLMAQLLNGLGMAEDDLDATPNVPPRPFEAEEGLTNFEKQDLHDIVQDDSTSGTISAGAPAPVHDANNNNKDDLLRSNVNVALSVVRTLAETHKAANVHDESKIQDDLRSLGLVLFQFFAGVAAPPDVTDDPAANNDSDDDQSERQCKRHGIGPSIQQKPAPSDVLFDAGLPSSVCILLMSLLKATDPSFTDRYTSSTDVEADLLRMMCNPDHYLFDPSPRSATDILDFSSDKLYGRDEQWKRMKTCFDSVVVRQEERQALVLLTGPAGSGKTSLVEKLRVPLAERRGMFLSVKFDSQGVEPPISRIFRAIEEYCQRLLLGDPTLLADVGLALRKALGSDGVVLKNLIPTLGIVIGGWVSTNFDMEQTETYNLIIHCLCMLIRAISGPTHPAIVLFDDLQCVRSDLSSLDIIRQLISDDETRCMLFIASFRGDEITEGHVLNRYLGDIMTAASHSESISLNNLDKDSVNALLSDILHLAPRLTRPLAGPLLIKTGGGNPMFLKQLLRSLYEDGLLQYSARSRRWVWDIDAISAKSVADNTVDLIVNKMMSYEGEIQYVLQTAACLGARFQLETMKILYSGRASANGVDGSEVLGHLATIVSDGLMFEKRSTFRFAHDQIWQAAYSLTAKLEQKAMHLFIGRQLLRSIPAEDLDAFIFTIVDQLNRGVDMIANHSEQLEIAELNLRAGEKALSTFSFLQASMYLLQGSILILREDWESNYDLCLRIFTACAEVQLAQGDNDAAIVSLNPVLANGKTLDDKLRAYHTLILAKAAQFDFRDSIQHALSVLQELGESFPDAAVVDQAVIMNEIGTTCAMVESTNGNIDEILAKPITTDLRKIAALRIMMTAARSAYDVNPSLMLLLVLRMVQIAMICGLTAESSYAFAALSFALYHFGNHDLSVYGARTATALLTKFDRKYSNIVATLLNSSILPVIQPMQACLDSFQQAYKDACSVGDLMWGRVAGTQIALISIAAPERGKNLEDVGNEIRQITEGVMHQGKGDESALTCLYLQLVLNLKSIPPTVDGDDPTILTGDVMNQDEFISMATEKKIDTYFRQIYFCQLYLAYLFRKYDSAAAKLDANRQIASSERFCSTCDTILETLYGGLISAAMLSQSHISNDDANKWRMLAKECLEKLKGWMELGSEWNFQHKYDLLRAEILAVDGEVDGAAAAYDAAIRGASEHCYVNEQALACERAGFFYLEKLGNVGQGKEYLIRAEKLYREWGAARKAVDLSHLLQQRCS